MRRPLVLDPLIATDQTCYERRIHHASRPVWSSCRDFRVISRKLGDRPTSYAAAITWPDATSRKFREMTFLTHAFGSVAA